MQPRRRSAARQQPASARHSRSVARRARAPSAVDPRLGVVLQQQRAHHRRQRQRDEARHQHRAGQRQREFDEQAAGTARRERQRRIHRHERQRHRDDREGDLARALDRRLRTGHALLDVAEDVLQHHDRVVDDQPDRQHHRQQRQRVDGETERAISAHAPIMRPGS